MLQECRVDLSSPLTVFNKLAMGISNVCSLAICTAVLIGQMMMVTILMVGAAPPEEPVQCSNSSGAEDMMMMNCSITSSYGVWPDRQPCWAAAVAYPTTEEELVAVVAQAVRRKQKMKVVSRWAHSIPKLVCPGGDDGLVISTRDYNRSIVIDDRQMAVTADSGVELRQLIDAVAEVGLALPYSPYWEGVSLGGLLSTGAHGSSFFGRGSAVHEYVTRMTLVVPASRKRGYASIITLDSTTTPELLSAAKVSLGVLGVISQVTLQLEPMFKRAITNDYRSDEDIEEIALPFGYEHEFGDITWHPSQGKVVYKIDDRVPIDVEGDGVNDFLAFQPTHIALVEAIRSLEQSFEATNNAQGKCVAAGVQIATLLALGTGLKNDEHKFQGYPVVGYQNRLQASGSCLRMPKEDKLRVCPWDVRVKGEFFHQTTVSIGVSRFREFVTDVKALRAMDASGLCGVDLYYGFYMRFVKKSTSAFLGEQEDAVSIDITYYRARDARTPALKQDVLQEIEQMAVMKHGGRPHWGKNRPVAFQGVWRKYTNMEAFLHVKRQLDPDGLFSSAWSDAMLGLDPAPLSSDHDGCALEGLCICSRDSHCAPRKGYFCRPGRIFSEARVCRHSHTTNDPMSIHQQDNVIENMLAEEAYPMQKLMSYSTTMNP